MSSFVSPSKSIVPNKERTDKAMELIKSATADGTGLSYKEIVGIVSAMKGDKISLRDKIVIKLTRKKLSTAIINAAGSSSDGKSQVTALLLCIFLGGLGIHRFYLGYTWQGIVQLLTLGGLGIWVLIDLVRIITGDLKPKDGEYGKTL